MNPLLNPLNWFPGYKTYILVAGVVLGAVSQWLTGDLSLGDMINQIALSLMGATIRKGIKTGA